jgi:hypothetical protein
MAFQVMKNGMWFLHQHVIFLDLIGMLVGKKDAGRWSIALLNVTPGSLAERYHWGGGCLHLLGGRKSLLNTISFLPDCMVWHTTRLWNSLDRKIAQDTESSLPLCMFSTNECLLKVCVCVISEVKVCAIWKLVVYCQTCWLLIKELLINP